MSNFSCGETKVCMYEPIGLKKVNELSLSGFKALLAVSP